MGDQDNPAPRHIRVITIERESDTRITYEMESGITRTIDLDAAIVDLLMEAWERFLSTPGQSDSPGG